MNEKTTCKACGAELNANTQFCPSCGAKVQKPFYKKWWVYVIAAVVLIAVIGAVGGENDANNVDSPSTSSSPVSSATDIPKSTPAATPVETPKSNVIKAGMYKVGTDIGAGEYLLISSGSGYYQLDSDSSGELDSIISNDNFNNTNYLTVFDGEYLTLTRCEMIPVADAEPQKAENGILGEGMYKVGYDIPAGEYKLVANDMGYCEVRTDSRGTINGIVTNDNFEGERYITVSDGQYLKLNRCSLKLNNE